jgi:hypothetical protein
MSELRSKNARSVEDLEADLKQMIGLQQPPQPRPAVEELHRQQQQFQAPPQARRIEMSAFDKFVSFRVLPTYVR